MAKYSDSITLASVSDGAPGSQGPAGPSGYNQATLYLYKRSENQPNKPTAQRQYNFSTGELTLVGTDDNWTRNIPSGNNPCYVSSVSVFSQNSSVTINSTDWSGVVKLVENGQDGSPGSDGAPGLNQATVYLYQRGSVTPTKPSQSLIYTFSTGGLTGQLSGWSQTIPSRQGNDNPCYITLATAISSEDTDTILSNEWQDPRLLAEDGEDGIDGDLYYVKTNYESIKRIAIDTENGFEYNFIPDVLTFEVHKRDESVLDINNSYNFSFIDSGVLISNLISIFDTTIINENNNIVTLNIKNLLELILTEGSDGEKVQHGIQGATGFFIFEVFEQIDISTRNVLIRKTIPVEDAISDDLNSLVSFKTTADSIQMAVGNSKLAFTDSGLTIYDGSLNIYGEDNENPLLSYDNSKKALSIVGSGSFTGNIYADNGYFRGSIETSNGYFSGELKSNSGNIGGFTISENQLVSADNNIQLNGSDGSIYAGEITLGQWATIEKYIRLGSGVNSAWIYNPNYAEDPNTPIGEDQDSGLTSHLPYFYKVNNNVSLTADGIFNLNRIVLDGVNSTIKGTGVKQNPNFGWPDFEITPEKAFFRNVDISGKISTMVFEVGHTQAVGGSMLFKPSYKVTSHENIEENHSTALFLDNNPADYLHVNSEYIILINDFGNIIGSPIQCSNIEGQKITINSEIEEVPISVIILGEENSLIVGINSTDVASTYLQPRGLTISEFKLNQDNYPVPKVYLGDLSYAPFDITGVSKETLGYGLFSNNVILNGSLTTQVGTDEYVITEDTSPQQGVEYYIYNENTEEYILFDEEAFRPYETYFVKRSILTYAGVNTLSKARAKVFDDDKTNIVFWAGSEGVSAKQIQSAPFQVTEKGSLYAQQGIFKDSIITDSEIRGADIYAARIHGVGNESKKDYGLAFYDVDEGIVFKRGGQTDDDAIALFGIGQHGLYTSEKKYFISVDNGVFFNGNQCLINYGEINSLRSEYISILAADELTVLDLNHTIQKTNLFEEPLLLPDDEEEFQNSFLDLNFKNKNISLGFEKVLYSTDQSSLSITRETDKKIDIYQDSCNIQVDTTTVQKDFNLGATMKYKKVGSGYNLYIA